MLRPMTRLALVLLWVPSIAAAQTVTIGGTATQLTTDPAVQIDPSISGDLVVFTDLRNGNDDIYYVDLTTGAEVQVTSDPTIERLHDVSGGVIVYTGYSAQDADVLAFDVATGTAAPVTTVPGIQEIPAIDGSLVTYNQRQLGEEPDIWATDLATGTSFPVAAGPQRETFSSVSGTRVVFLRIDPATGERLVVVADTLTGTETVLGPGNYPTIDGDIVVFDASAPGRTDSDIFIHDLSTGVTEQLDLPGNQRLGHASGDLVALDDDSEGDPDVAVYHRPSGTLYRVTEQGSAEYLNDIDGNRIVYTSTASGNLDIWLFTIEITVEEPPAAVPDDPCTDAGEMELLSSVTFTRGSGKPVVDSATFTDTRGGGPAVLVLRSEKCASAWADLNGEPILHTDELASDLACQWNEVTLEAENLLETELRSKPGCTVTFEFWAPATPADPVLVIDAAALGGPELEPVGCNQATGSAGWLAVLAVLGLLLWRSGPAPARVRVRRRR